MATAWQHMSCQFHTLICRCSRTVHVGDDLCKEMKHFSAERMISCHHLHFVSIISDEHKSQISAWSPPSISSAASRPHKHAAADVFFIFFVLRCLSLTYGNAKQTLSFLHNIRLINSFYFMLLFRFQMYVMQTWFRMISRCRRNSGLIGCLSLHDGDKWL